MKSEFEVLVSKDKKEIDFPSTINADYFIYLPLTLEQIELQKKAEEFEKETGLKTNKPQKKHLFSLCKEREDWFPNLPKKENESKIYKITIEEV